MAIVSDPRLVLSETRRLIRNDELLATIRPALPSRNVAPWPVIVWEFGAVERTPPRRRRCSHPSVPVRRRPRRPATASGRPRSSRRPMGSSAGRRRGSKVRCTARVVDVAGADRCLRNARPEIGRQRWKLGVDVRAARVQVAGEFPPRPGLTGLRPGGPGLGKPTDGAIAGLVQSAGAATAGGTTGVGSTVPRQGRRVDW